MSDVPCTMLLMKVRVAGSFFAYNNSFFFDKLAYNNSFGQWELV